MYETTSVYSMSKGSSKLQAYDWPAHMISNMTGKTNEDKIKQKQYFEPSLDFSGFVSAVIVFVIWFLAQIGGKFQVCI